MLDRNTILTLNKDPKSIDLHNLALAKSKAAKLNAGSSHQFIQDRDRSKGFKNYDEAYQKYIKLKNSGFLDLFNKKHGIGTNTNPTINPTKKIIKEVSESSLIHKIDSLIEMAPIAPFNGPGAGPDSSSKQFILKEEYANKSSKNKKTS